MALADSKTLKAMVEFREGKGTTTYSLYMILLITIKPELKATSE